METCIAEEISLKILTVYQRSQIFAHNKVVQVLSYRSPLLKWPELSSFVWKTTRITQQKYYLHMLWSTTNPERTKSKVCVTTAMRSKGKFQLSFPRSRELSIRYIYFFILQMAIDASNVKRSAASFNEHYNSWIQRFRSFRHRQDLCLAKIQL